jgi:hypothetical protein
MGVPRKVVQIAATTTGESPGCFYLHLFALADDGTIWCHKPEIAGWMLLAGLPDAEACGTKTGDVDGACRLAKGHREHHWSGSRRWA